VEGIEVLADGQEGAVEVEEEAVGFAETPGGDLGLEAGASH